MKIVGIDLAENAGVSYCDYEDPYLIKCSYLKGLPYEQMNQLLQHIDISQPNIISIEDFVYFGLNAKTSASLLRRLGYFQYHLESLGQTVILIKPNAARKWLESVDIPDELKELKPKDKVYKFLMKYISNKNNVKITNDITDAIALLITQQNLEVDKIRVEMV